MIWIRSFLIQIFIFVIFLEFFCFLGTKFELFIVNDTPKIYKYASKETNIDVFRLELKINHGELGENLIL